MAAASSSFHLPNVHQKYYTTGTSLPFGLVGTSKLGILQQGEDKTYKELEFPGELAIGPNNKRAKEERDRHTDSTLYTKL